MGRLIAMTAALIVGCGADVRRDAVGIAVQMAVAEKKDRDDAAPGDAKQAAPRETPRKIKYVAEVFLVADDFAQAEADLARLVELHEGHFATVDRSSTPGSPRHGVWKVRVPVAKFDAFRKAVEKIADLERSSLRSEDVTAEFYDLEQHIKNAKAHEEALRGLLAKTTDKIENLLAVQRELASVRDSIERSEGRLRVLANLVDLTTVTISIQERARFRPDDPTSRTETPGFGQRAAGTFSGSVDAIVRVGEWIALVAIGLAPWLPLLALAFGCVCLVRRRRNPPTADLAPASPTSEP